jgi:hypothetical protein
MRTRLWLVGLVLVGLCVGWGAAPARAAIWPFSIFMPSKPPVKRHKPKPARPRPLNMPTR